ncbi:MAG TPA: FAD-dependent oxidoreductase [bacterium]|nr:FAD-dependent oxidoreductase [bacterium]
MQEFDVIIIGGGPSGIITGITGKKQNPDKSFLMIKEDDKGLVPCGIPYVFHDLKGVKDNEMGPKGFINVGGEVLIDRVVEIDTDTKQLSTKDGKEFSYGKLVFATGSSPIIPEFIEGYDLDGVHYIRKRYNYIDKLHSEIEKKNKIVVIGGGFIGVEVAEQLAKHKDKEVSIVEMAKHCLYQAFSPDFAAKSDKLLTEVGVNVITEKSVKKILGKDGKVTGVEMADGYQIDADLVISAIGFKPNTDLAQVSGLELDQNGAIQVDNYLRTSVKEVYAVGDCSATHGFITGRTDNIMLASTATAKARVLGYNLSNIKLLRNFYGTLSVFSTEIHGHAFASAGAIEQTAREANVSFVTGKFKTMDRHPGTIKGAKEIEVKLIVSPGNGEIIGGELCGGKSVGEMINIIALAIQKAVTVYELVSFQIGTHPLLTTAPTKYPLIKAAEDAINKIESE